MFSVIQLEKCREANIRNQFEFEAKKLLVENIKVRYLFDKNKKNFLLRNQDINIKNYVQKIFFYLIDHKHQILIIIKYINNKF
jgi:hypothetical protein